MWVLGEHTQSALLRLEACLTEAGNASLHNQRRKHLVLLPMEQLAQGRKRELRLAGCQASIMARIQEPVLGLAVSVCPVCQIRC